jgi:general secretion pathway protein L
MGLQGLALAGRIKYDGVVKRLKTVIKMKRKILGLDIREDAVSAVLLAGSIKKTEIEAHQYVPISDPADFESGLAAALATVIEKIDVTGAVCAASFPADRISYRNLQVPFKKENKIRQMLPYELEPALPFAVDELIIDFHSLTFPDQADHTKLIAAAIKKTELESYLGILASLNIEPEIVTVGGYAAALCLTRLIDSPENLLFLDIDNCKGSIFAVVSGEICLIRSFPIYSDNSSSAAESLCIGIRHTWAALEEIYDLDFQPAGLFVTGCGLDDPSVEQDLARTLQISTEQINLTNAAEIASRHHSGQPWDPCQMDNALALALMEAERLRGLNFRRGPFAAKKFWSEHKASLLKTGVIAGLVLALAFSNVVLGSYFMEKKLVRLDREISDIFTSTFPDVKNIRHPYQQMQAKIKALKTTAALPEGGDKNIRAIDILNDISRLIPKETDVDLTRLVIGSESVMIEGDTATFNAVDDIKSRLEQVVFFKKITITSANIDRSDNRVRFKLKVHL